MKKPVVPSYCRATLLVLGLLVGLKADSDFEMQVFCGSGKPPPWLFGLVAEIKRLQYPGIQFSYSDGRGGDYDCALGMATTAPVAERLTTGHRFRYASLTKVLTSLTAMQLIEEGLLKWDGRLVDYLDKAGPFNDERVTHITIGDLLQHTAGFDRVRSGDPMLSASPWCPHDWVRGMELLKLDFNPGSKYAYSNLGYCLLGLVIARVEQMSLEEVYRRRFIRPLQLDMHTVVRGRHLPEEVTIYPKAQENMDTLNGFDYSAMLATGAWGGTAREFRRFLQASMFGPMLSPAARQRLLAINGSCDVRQWRKCHGAGFYAYRPEGGPTLYWRDGSLPGVTAFAAFREDGSVLVLLANSRDYAWLPVHDRLGLAIYRWMQTVSNDNFNFQ